jgi:dTDP-4-dehydrorhamnose reductase
MKLLVLGRSGQVARALAELAPELGFDTACIGRDEADLLTADAPAILGRHAPDLVINAAAFTHVDRAESETEAAFALNAEMPGRFARAAGEAGVPFLHLSTDSVFDGEKGAPYAETDPPRPINAYGRTKLAGEEAVLAAPGETAVIRTAWVYGPHGANFVPTMLRLAREREEVSVVEDQYGSPTWVGDIARACLLIGKAGGRGILHASGGGGASRAELAEALFELSSALGGPSARVRRVPASEFPTPAARQADTRLDCSKLEALAGWRPPPWRERLAEVLPRFL